ncbi:hemolysin family protein [Gleimia sp. 6138-11-ORH1]|uniref:hemolysin family protein n=1 Tax=Gleimia sp. 6138-11-ORH1 TaxID=2973937 RepID=UPI002169AF80|nr:hemolysin family protein [Gleimia sp. 6138-11-ORH1]MCS4484078.1 hemolysin family protein [Gleimia sp. 6138-11-ORH1]
MSATTGIIITILLLLINAFFVAGEFAVTSSRRAQIEPLAENGVRGADKALWAIEHVSLMLSICQLGITVASTSLGAVAEPAIAHLVEEPLLALNLPAGSAHVVGFTVALAIVLYLHIVFGEMVPKNLSVSMPDKALLWLAPPLVAIGRVLKPVILFMDWIANWFVRGFGFEPKSEVASAFTVEEVASIVELSTAQGTLHDDLGLLSGTLEFSEESVADTMVPTAQLVSLAHDVSPAEVEREVARTGFSRYPVISETGALQGYLHIKDVLYATGAEREMPIPAWRIRDLPPVNGEDEVEEALREMQRLGTHLAEVYKDGESVGVLFLEDILEELVGEVHDTLQRDQLL